MLYLCGSADVKIYRRAHIAVLTPTKNACCTKQRINASTTPISDSSMVGASLVFAPTIITVVSVCYPVCYHLVPEIPSVSHMVLKVTQ